MCVTPNFHAVEMWHWHSKLACHWTQMHTKPARSMTVLYIWKFLVLLIRYIRSKIFIYRAYRDYNLHLTTCKYTVYHVMYFELRRYKQSVKCKFCCSLCFSFLDWVDSVADRWNCKYICWPLTAAHTYEYPAGPVSTKPSAIPHVNQVKIS